MNVTLNHGVPTNETSGDCDAYAHKDLYAYTVRRKNNSGDVDTKKYILHCGCVIGSRVITIDVRVELVDASKNLFLLRDNAPARHAAAVTAFLESKQLKMLPHPPCSPDLAPCNYFSSLRLRITTKGRRYDDMAFRTSGKLRRAFSNKPQKKTRNDRLAHRLAAQIVVSPREERVSNKMKHFPRNSASPSLFFQKLRYLCDICIRDFVSFCIELVTSVLPNTHPLEP